METETAVQPVSFIEKEIKKFESSPEFSRESLLSLADSFKDLTSNIILQEEKGKLKEVYAARQVLKAKRVAITKAGKVLREDANRFRDAVIAKEKELVSLISPTEELLEQRENEYHTEKERLRLEEEKKESDRIQVMIDKLSAVNYAVDFHELKGLTEEQFENLLVTATELHNKKLEEERIAKEERERLDREEAERQEKERAELERIRKENEDKQRELKAKQDELEQKERERLEKIRIEEDERRRQFEAKEKELAERQAKLDADERERKHQAEVEQARKDAEAKAKRGAEEKARFEEEERIERERLEKEEQEEKLRVGEDSDRFVHLIKQIDQQFIASPIWQHFTSKKGKSESQKVLGLFQAAISICVQNSKKAHD